MQTPEYTGTHEDTPPPDSRKVDEFETITDRGEMEIATGQESGTDVDTKTDDKCRQLADTMNKIKKEVKKSGQNTYKMMKDMQKSLAKQDERHVEGLTKLEDQMNEGIKEIKEYVKKQLDSCVTDLKEYIKELVGEKEKNKNMDQAEGYIKGTDNKETLSGNTSRETTDRCQGSMALIGVKNKMIDVDQNKLRGEIPVKETTINTLEDTDDVKLVELNDIERREENEDSDLTGHNTEMEVTDHEIKPTDDEKVTVENEALIYANASKAKKRRIRRKRAEERIRLKEETRRARTEERLKQQAEEDARKQIVPYVGNSTTNNTNTANKVYQAVTARDRYTHQMMCLLAQVATVVQQEQNEAACKPIMQDEAVSKPIAQDKAASKQIIKDKATSIAIVQDQDVSKSILQDKAVSKLTIQDEIACKPIILDEVAFKSTAQDEAAYKPTVQNEAAQKPMVQAEATSEQIVQDEAVSKPAIGHDEATSNLKVQDEAVSKQIVQNEAAFKPISQDVAAFKEIVQNDAASKPISQDIAAYKEIVQNDAASKPISQDVAAYKVIVQSEPTFRPVGQNECSSKQIIQDKAASEPTVQKKDHSKPIIQDETASKKLVQDEAAAKQIAQDEVACKPRVHDEAAAKPIVQDSPRKLPLSQNKNGFTTTEHINKWLRRPFVRGYLTVMAIIFFILVSLFIYELGWKSIMILLLVFLRLEKSLFPYFVDCFQFP